METVSKFVSRVSMKNVAHCYDLMGFMRCWLRFVLIKKISIASSKRECTVVFMSSHDLWKPNYLGQKQPYVRLQFAGNCRGKKCAGCIEHCSRVSGGPWQAAGRAGVPHPARCGSQLPRLGQLRQHPRDGGRQAQVGPLKEQSHETEKPLEIFPLYKVEIWCDWTY